MRVLTNSEKLVVNSNRRSIVKGQRTIMIKEKRTVTEDSRRGNCSADLTHSEGQTESAEQLMRGVDKSLTLYMRCLVRYWLWTLAGRPVRGSDVETALRLVSAGHDKTLVQSVEGRLRRKLSIGDGS